MTPLHRRVIDAKRARHPAWEPVPATPRDLAAAERTLGRALPKSYRAFLREVGPIWWPLEAGLPYRLAVDDAPAYFVAFAHDGAGNYHGFDTRSPEGPELAINFYDHEDPQLEAVPPGAATPFAEWLEETLDDAQEDTTQVDAERTAARFHALLGARTFGRFTPTEGEVARGARELGVRLPPDYAVFTTRFGSTSWPLEIVDALDLAATTAALRRDHPRARQAPLAAFARDGGGAYWAFDARGRIVAYGAREPPPATFAAFLERAVDDARDRPAERAASRLPLARALLERLSADGLLEPAAGFSLDAASAALDGLARWSGTAVLELLVARPDVAEVYASPAEIEQVLRAVVADAART